MSELTTCEVLVGSNPLSLLLPSFLRASSQEPRLAFLPVHLGLIRETMTLNGTVHRIGMLEESILRRSFDKYKIV